jgi:hypothetical protein
MHAQQTGLQRHLRLSHLSGREYKQLRVAVPGASMTGRITPATSWASLDICRHIHSKTMNAPLAAPNASAGHWNSHDTPRNTTCLLSHTPLAARPLTAGHVPVAVALRKRSGQQPVPAVANAIKLPAKSAQLYLPHSPLDCRQNHTTPLIQPHSKPASHSLHR